MSKKLTLDTLAQMVKHGFDQTATKDDLRALEQKMDAGFFAVNRRIDLLHDDLSDLPDIRDSVQDLTQRMERVERKVGLTQ